MNLLKINKCFTSKTLLISEVTFPSELSEKRILKRQNHVFITLTINVFFSIFESVKIRKQVFVFQLSPECLKKTVNIKSPSNVRMKVKKFSHTQQLLSPATSLKNYFYFLLRNSWIPYLSKEPLK